MRAIRVTSTKPVLIGERVCTKGVVAEAEDFRAAELVKRGHAEYVAAVAGPARSNAERATLDNRGESR